MGKHKSISDSIAWIATVFLFSSITIFESYTWGKYVLLLACMVVFLCDAFATHFKYKIYIGPFHYFMIVLILFTLLSSVWAISAKESLTKAVTFCQILLFIIVLYNHYVRFEDVSQLIQVIKWASYIVSIYSINYYGIGLVRSMIQSAARLDNSFSNINTIGMLAAIGIVIKTDELVREKKASLELILTIPSFIMIITTQSRKALLILVLGTLLVFIGENLRRKSVLRNIFIILIFLLFSFFIIRYLMTLRVFSGIEERFQYLIAMLIGRGEIGYSAKIRGEMIVLGFEIFKKYPIGGVGIGNPHLVAAQELSFDAYLHNNFVELLAGGGLIGFFIFYFSYLFLFLKFKEFYEFKDRYYVLCVILALIFLFRDVAMVSVYDKATYFYFMMFFIMLNQLKHKANSL